MSKASDHEILSKVSTLLLRLQSSAHDPSLLHAIIRENVFGDTAKQFHAVVMGPPSANDHLTEEQVTDAVRVCDDLVTAYVVGEEPASISWLSLDNCDARARTVIGQDRVHEIYKMYRPEQLPGYVDDEAAGFPAIR